MREFRKDPVRGRWTIIATERTGRPTDFKKAPAESPEVRPCPFCEDTAGPVRVLTLEPARFSGSQAAPGAADGIYHSQAGLVRHEVIVETPRHGVFLDALDPEETARVVDAYVERLSEIEREKGVRYPFLFKNQFVPRSGDGKIVRHSHSEIYALPVVPKKVEEETTACRDFYLKSGSCLFCRMLAHELSHRRRTVEENEGFAALVPYAAQSPFEIVLLPKAHGASFTELAGASRASFGRILSGVLKKLARVLRQRPFYLALHTLPVPGPEPQIAARESYHWHVEISPRTYFFAGFEWGGGIFINTAAPEESARTLREAI